MVNSWPAVLRRAHPSARVLGEIALGAALLATLTFSPRDTFSTDPDRSAGPVVRYQALPVEQTSVGLTLPGLRNLASLAGASGIAVSSNALIPTSPPAMLLIPSLNVHRPVERVGVNRYGVMNLPVNGWNAGWLSSGPVPGAPGDAVIEGHAGFPDQPMLFGRLGNLRTGDQVIVVLKDGSRRLFSVVSMAAFPAGVTPPGMAQAYGSPRLTLITCSGSFDANTYSYSNRLVVELSYAGRA